MAAASSSSSSSSPSSSSSSSTSSPSSSDPDYKVTTSDLDDDAAGVELPSSDEEFLSVLRTQGHVDAVCKKYGISEDQYTALPAGDLRASSSPPHGAVCVYAHALEAGMRVPLHPFFVDALNHFGLAPTQLAPNGWRIMAGFVVLCHSAGVSPSLAVFRRFFMLSTLPHSHKQKKGWYYFHPRSRDRSGLRFTGLPESIKDWKRGFFFLCSPTAWPCPVEWGRPSKSSLVDPVLSTEDEASAAKLLRAQGASFIDLRKYLCRSNLANAGISPLSAPARAPSSPQLPAPEPSSPQPSSPEPPPSYTCTATEFKVMDPAVYGMMKSMLAAKAAVAQTPASANKVKIEPGGDATRSSPLRGKKRNLDEAGGSDGPPCVLPNTPPTADDSSAPTGICSPTEAFSRSSRKMQHIPSGHDGDSTDWVAARERLRGVVPPQQERVFAATEPSDIVASSYIAILQYLSVDGNDACVQAANYASFSLAYALELEQRLVARDAEVAALRTQLEKSEDKLAAAEAEAEMMKAELAVRRRAQDALDGYERWRGGSKT
ncbi:uncharacterized protein [Triticum aestivum]|uniref:uncharacterized protein isoform X1 n=2 Tax=Triticum TaxID=4564 RepID=UPI0008439B40|nr:uncharacterized protein LOC123162319 isoform X1 [Triticum aestivum]